MHCECRKHRVEIHLDPSKRVLAGSLKSERAMPVKLNGMSIFFVIFGRRLGGFSEGSFLVAGQRSWSRGGEGRASGSTVGSRDRLALDQISRSPASKF